MTGNDLALPLFIGTLTHPVVVTLTIIPSTTAAARYGRFASSVVGPGGGT